MKILTPLILLIIIFSSCKKDDEIVSAFSEAGYTVEVTGKWTGTDHGVPPSAHFTIVAGAVHRKDVHLWKAGQLANIGVENLAETGDISSFRLDIDTMILDGKASFFFIVTQPPLTGTSAASIHVNTNFSCFSFASMIAPSPDWFIGIDGFALYRDDKWITDTTIQLYAYDAGTESGDVFGYANPPSSPQEPVSVLSASKGTVLANGNDPIRAIAAIRFRKK
jgi:hypothetical protein